jgi:hypothetical protein
VYGVLETIFVPLEDLKYRYRISGISRGPVEILQRLQKSYSGCGNAIEAARFPEGPLFFHRPYSGITLLLKKNDPGWISAPKLKVFNIPAETRRSRCLTSKSKKSPFICRADERAGFS